MRGRGVRADQAAEPDVAVFEDDERRLAAQLEEHTLHGRAGRGHDLATDRRRAGEGNNVDVGMGRELHTDRVVGRRDHIDDARGNVGGFGDELAERERGPRRVGRALEHHRASRRERGRELRERELDRVVVRRDRSDDPRAFLLDPTVVPARKRVALAEVFDELVALDQVGVPGDDIDRGFELRPTRDRNRRADFTHDDLAQRLDVVEQRLVQLAQPPHPNRGIARPIGLVERAPGGTDGPVDIGDGGVGRHAQNFLGRRVDRLVRRAALGGNQRAVDQQPLFVPVHLFP